MTKLKLEHPCPFCPIFLPDNPEMHYEVGYDFFGKAAQIKGIDCCDGCACAASTSGTEDALVAILYRVRAKQQVAL